MMDFHKKKDLSVSLSDSQARFSASSAENDVVSFLLSNELPLK